MLCMLWMSKVYGIPAGMYAIQVWGTVYLSEGSEFGSSLSRPIVGSDDSCDLVSWFFS